MSKILEIGAEYLIPVALTIFGFVVGALVEKIIFGRLRKAAQKTKWQIDDILVNSFKGLIALWIALLFLKVSIDFVGAAQSTIVLISKIILLIFIISVTILFLRIASEIIDVYTFRLLPSTTTLFKTITRMIIIALGALIFLKSLGVEISPLLATLGIGGLAVALALQDTLSNLFAGIYIVMAKQIAKGNYIKLESGEEGYVVDIGWRNTTVRMLPNNLVIIPNSKISASIVTNYHLPEKEMSVLVQVGVSYDSDLEKVERVTIEVAKEVMREVAGGVPEFEPFIRYHTFADFSINFSVILRAQEFVDQFLVKHEFIKRLHKRYKEEGIVIPFPITTVIMDKGGER